MNTVLNGWIKKSLALTLTLTTAMMTTMIMASTPPMAVAAEDTPLNTEAQQASQAAVDQFNKKIVSQTEDKIDQLQNQYKQQEQAGADPEVLAETLQKIAGLYRSINDFGQAVTYYNQAIDQYEKVQTFENPLNYANTLKTLAAFYAAKQDFDQSESLLKRAAGLVKPGEAGYDTLQMDLGNFYYVQARQSENHDVLPKALTYFNQAYNEAKSQTPPKTIRMIEAKSGVARVYALKNDLVNARKELNIALNDAKAVWGEDHPNTQELVRSLALIDKAEEASTPEKIKLRQEWKTHALAASEHMNQQRYQEAETDFLKAMAIAKQVGPDSMEMAATLTGLSSAYMAQKKFKAAEPILEQSIEVNSKLFGADNQDVMLQRDALKKIQAMLNTPEGKEPAPEAKPQG
ncbi:MAG: tetratricopeptide repeat protein [Cyanobacteria bacterium HKST-UBA04]|nr:tetratricopeptide repeat protein [Cyanobacteria bacterium HKST-UBA04]